MSFPDYLLLEGSEPPPWDDDSAPHGLCDQCDSPLVAEGYCAECPELATQVPLERSPVIASFNIDEHGTVTWAGWCADVSR